MAGRGEAFPAGGQYMEKHQVKRNECRRDKEAIYHNQIMEMKTGTGG